MLKLFIFPRLNRGFISTPKGTREMVSRHINLLTTYKTDEIK